MGGLVQLRAALHEPGGCRCHGGNASHVGQAYVQVVGLQQQWHCWVLTALLSKAGAAGWCTGCNIPPQQLLLLIVLLHE